MSTRFTNYFDEINGPAKIEACIETRCKTLEERSLKLRGMSEDGKILKSHESKLLWTIKDAKEEFAHEECHRICEYPLDIF